jgi:hypothetical protein
LSSWTVLSRKKATANQGIKRYHTSHPSSAQGPPGIHDLYDYEHPNATVQILVEGLLEKTRQSFKQAGRLLQVNSNHEQDRQLEEDNR